MREAPAVHILRVNGEAYGLHLAPDPSHPAHRLGIESLRRALGIGRLRWSWRRMRLVSPPIGAERHRVTRPDGVAISQELGATKASLGDGTNESLPSSSFGASWDDQGVVLWAREEAGASLLRSFFEGTALGQLLMVYGENSHPLEAGLYLLRADRAPQAMLEAIAGADREDDALREAAQATRIEAKLRAHGMRFFALSPAWKDRDAQLVHFWLNPEDHATCRAGWYSVEDLVAWCRGEGPVVKSYADMGIPKPARAHGKHRTTPE